MKTTAVSLVSLFIAVFCYAQSASDFRSYEQTVPGSNFHFRMMPIKAGEFLMGSLASEQGRKQDEGTQQRTHISAFWMAAYEVTRDELDVFLKDENTSQNSDVDAVTRPSPQYIDFSLGMGKEGGFPANSMSQYAALMYCRWLYNKTGIFYRLPTEAEWEYACRAGSTSRYFFGDDSTQLGNYAWYEPNSEDRFHKVGQKQPNAWGLYDMLGNVMEWTLDHYTPTKTAVAAVVSDPFATASTSKYPKVLRGGGYSDKASALRSASRSHSEPSWNRRDPQIPKSRWWLTDAPSVGIRIVRPLKQPTAPEIEQFFSNYLGS